MKTDLLFAFRSLRKAPAFFALAVATLALGIAANTAIFSLFYQVLLRSLPVPDAQQLVVFHYDRPLMPGNGSSDADETVFSYPFYLRVRDIHAFQGVAARASAPVQMLAGAAAERTRAEVVSGNFFDVLGLRARLGRLFTPADDSVRGGNPVAVLAYDYWVRRFGSSAAAINRTVILNGRPFTIIGVAAEGFRGIVAGNSPEVFVPISMRGALTPGWNSYDEPGGQWLTLIGRLAPGISRAAAQAQLQPQFTSFVRDYLKQIKAPESAFARFEHVRLEMHPASQGLNSLEKQWRKPLFVLLAMVLLLLVIACANLANLLMARAVNRRREIAVRIALGAGSLRVIRLLLTESVLVAFSGTVCGILLAPVLAGGIIRLMPAGAISGWLNTDLNIPLLLFSAALMVMATLLFGLAPALQAAGGEGSSLGERSQTTGSGAVHTQTRKALLIGQLALSLMLLCTAGLFGRSLVNLMRFQPGFRADHLLTFSIDAGLGGYDTERGLNLYRSVLRRVEALSGVRSAAIGFSGPLSHSLTTTNVSVEGYAARNEDEMLCEANAVGPAYFRTMGTPLAAGREFNERDTFGAPKVAIVNEAFVRRYIGNRSAVGVRMQRGAGGPNDTTIVGVSADAVTQDLREPVAPVFYVPFEQTVSPGPRILRASFFVRTNTGLENLASAVRAAVAQVDPTLPVFALHPMQVIVNESIYTDRLVAALSTAFGLLALVLTAVGLYGVISYLVTRRTAEIGIRMVLGAQPRTIVSMILAEVGFIVIAGGAVGLFGALAAGRAIQSQLFGMSGEDPLVLCAAVLVLAAVALTAACIPAIRASRVEPLTALRHE